MFGLEKSWQGELSEYIICIAWSPQGILAASSAAGEVGLFTGEDMHLLLSPGEYAIDCLDFSQEGKFLAAGGQDGKVRIWRLSYSETGSLANCELITSLHYPGQWIDRLNWSPRHNQLAFSLGKQVNIWDSEKQEAIASLSFGKSSVFGISWRGDGKYLALGGNRGVKVWNTFTWEQEPETMNLPVASLAIAWSPDGNYLATTNLDKSLTVWQWGNPNPWQMRGFTGKVRNLTWSKPFDTGAQLLAVSSLEGIAVWHKETEDWKATTLELHEGIVQNLAFNPHCLLLASADEQGWLLLWAEARQLGQIIEGVRGGYSCLLWNTTGQKLAVGGKNGEIVVYLYTAL